VRSAVLVVVAGACAARAPEPLPAPIVARGEVEAPPIPAFGAVQRIGACAIRFGRATDDERRARLAAYRARLPYGAAVTHTDRGDRAKRVTVAIDQARLVTKKRSEWLAERLADELIRDTAELWGLPRSSPGANAMHATESDRDGRAWAFEFEGEVPGPGETKRLRIVTRVDLERRRIDAAAIDEPLPEAAVCAGPGPVIDAPRMIRDVIAQPARGSTIDPRDVGSPGPMLRTDGDVVHWVAAVPVGHDLAAHASETNWTDFLESIVLVDPATDAVIDRMPRPGWCGTQPFDPVAEEADRELGPP
jgi:hypothetical protein